MPLDDIFLFELTTKADPVSDLENLIRVGRSSRFIQPRKKSSKSKCPLKCIYSVCICDVDEVRGL